MNTFHKNILFATIVITAVFEVSANYKWQKTPMGIVASTGCCNDKVECDNVNGQPTYLGIDTAFQTDPEKEWFAVVYRNIITQFYPFGSDTSPRFQATGRLEDKKTRNWSGILAKICPHHVNASFGSVKAAFNYLNDIYVICNETTYKLDSIDNAYTAKVLGTYKRDQCSKQPHPLLCLNKTVSKENEEKEDTLIDIVAFPTSEDETNFVMGFFGDSQITEVYDFNRNYTIKAYLNDKFVGSQTVEGQLSAIDWYKVSNDGKWIEGFYFTNDGNACHFKRQMDSKQLVIEVPAATRPPCFTLNSFLACPQPWCSDVRFDSSFTVKGKKEKSWFIYLLRNVYYWKVEKRNLPLHVPRASKAVFTGFSFLTACNEFKTIPELKDHVPCVMMQTEASFAFYSKSTEYVYMLKSMHGNAWYVVTNRTATSKKVKAADLPISADSAWFNAKENAVHIFKDRTHSIYKFVAENEGKKSVWEKVKSGGDNKQFGIGAPNIDAVVNFDDKGYFFTTKNWLYEIPEVGWSTENLRKPKSAFVDFFNTKSECYFNDDRSYGELMQKYDVTIDTVTSFEKFHVYEGHHRNAEESESSVVEYIVLVIMAVFSLTVITVVVRYFVNYEEQ